MTENTNVVRITDEAQTIALRYGGSVSKGIIAMGLYIQQGMPKPEEPKVDVEGTMKKVLSGGVTLSPATKLFFQELNRTLVECISNHNSI